MALELSCGILGMHRVAAWSAFVLAMQAGVYVHIYEYKRIDDLFMTRLPFTSAYACEDL